MTRVEKKMWLAGLTAALVFASGAALAQQGSDAPLMKGDARPTGSTTGRRPVRGRSFHADGRRNPA